MLLSVSRVCGEWSRTREEEDKGPGVAGRQRPEQRCGEAEERELCIALCHTAQEEDQVFLNL